MTMHDKRALVLLSGGQDSTTCLFWAKGQYRTVATLAFDYGQQHRSELVAARSISVDAGAERHEECPLVFPAGLSVLTGAERSHMFDDEGRLLPETFVAGRNAVFLSMALPYAVAWGASSIVIGANAVDYSGYPDCRPQFIEGMEKALRLALPMSLRGLQVEAPLLRLSKREIVTLAQTLSGCWDALRRTVTCYDGQRPGCGSCDACRLRAQGFRAAGLEDPHHAC